MTHSTTAIADNSTKSNQNHSNKSEITVPYRNNRIWELDFIRGICIFLMVFDHAMLTIYFAFSDTWLAQGGNGAIAVCKFASNYFRGSLRETVRPAILFLFFSICGISSSFSRSNFKRGIQLAICALALSIGSFIACKVIGDDGYFIHFGVLNMLSVCILFWTLICHIFPNRTSAAFIALTLAMFFLAINNIFDNMNYNPASDSLLSIVHENFSPDSSKFSPGDYFPILPNITMFLIGAFIGPTIYAKKRSLLPFLDWKIWRPIEFLGRHTLIIMLLHILLVSLIISLLSVLFITPGNWVIF